MALIPAHRRYLGPVILVLLALLMAGSLIPDPTGPWRPFTVPPGRTGLTNRLNAVARAVRQYFDNNLAYAHSLPYLRGSIEYALRTPSDPRVYFGRDAHLFYSGEDIVNQSTGSFYRADRVRHFVDVVDTMRRILASRGSDVVVLVPPNTQTVPTRDEPSWWRISGPLEYDLAMRELRERGIATIDLKAVLSASPQRDELYRRTDSHWRRNAALAAFNMTMRAIGHDEWSLDPATTLTPLEPAPAGDLARLLGLEDRLSDADYAWRIGPRAGWTAIDVFRGPPYAPWSLPYAFERAPSGERLLVLGDSFTMEFWQPLLMNTGAARVGWMHFADCAFDFDDVLRFAPTRLIVAPTERLIPCKLDKWPTGLPHDAAAMASR